MYQGLDLEGSKRAKYFAKKIQNSVALTTPVFVSAAYYTYPLLIPFVYCTAHFLTLLSTELGRISSFHGEPPAQAYGKHPGN
jgi:hypothetical protein